ncbi:MAG: ABC transporter permease subunit [Deltaproteobacteria bacterium]|nr:ABC transporter permease subunit [Deltaproteobacteria bacterium]
MIGSKIDTEGRMVGEIFAQLLEDRGFAVERRLALGGTTICFEALKRGEIDLYLEYSGTLKAMLNHPEEVSYSQLQRETKTTYDLELLSPLGFNNTYVLAVRGDIARKYGLQKVSDLRAHPDLRYGISHEFLHRDDGWPMLARRYGIPMSAVGIDHGLSYQAIADDRIDVTDAYSTDGKLQRYDVILLADDRKFFPQYLAAPLVTSMFPQEALNVLHELAGKISDTKMQSINAMVEIHGKSYTQAAHLFLSEAGLLQHESAPAVERFWRDLASRTLVHLGLVFISVMVAMVIAIPLGVLIYRFPVFAHAVLGTAGILQTVPSIALLACLIPLFGIGVKPTIIALLLYALLPMLRNTTIALTSVDPVVKQVATGMGLTAWQQLYYIEFPLALPTILAGIRTAAVITVGTATLAAFIGAGGLGEPIVAGLNLNNPELVLEGAVPAALLAIGVEGLFELIERKLLPKHLVRLS